MKGCVGEGKAFQPSEEGDRYRAEIDVKRERERNKIDRKIIIYNSLFPASLSCRDYYQLILYCFVNQIGNSILCDF